MHLADAAADPADAADPAAPADPADAADPGRDHVTASAVPAPPEPPGRPFPAGYAGLVAAEASAAAHALPGAWVEAADLEQAVWLRVLELGGQVPAEPGAWVRSAVAAEARAAAARGRYEGGYEGRYEGGHAGRRGGGAQRSGGVEERAVRGEALHTIRSAVAALPGRCPELVAALLSGSDPTYREISRELGISQGSLGPLRSRCLGCLRSVLNSRVGSPVRRGNAR